MPEDVTVKYELRVIDGHPFIVLDDRLALIDTGSPFSIGRGRDVTVLGREWNPSTASEHVIDTASESLGHEVEWLFGSDFLNVYRVLLDDIGRVAILSTEPIELENSCEIRLAFVMGVPLIEIHVEGAPVRAILDTGAAISYAPPSATEGRTSIRTVSDFYPMFGTFETGVWEVEAEVCGEPLRLDVGALPDMLQMMLGMISEGWIVGREFFAGRKVLIDYPGGNVHR